MIRNFVCKDHKILKNVSQKDIKKYVKKKKVNIWIDLEKPTDAEFKFIQQTFNFHNLSIVDCKRSIDLPKLDTFEDHIFIVLHSAPTEFKGVSFKRKEIEFFLGKNYLVTVHNYKSPSADYLAEKLEKDKQGTSRTADFFMYEIMNHAVDLFFPLLDHWEDYIEDLEANIISHKASKTVLKEVMRLKGEVLHLRKSIGPQRDVVNRLSRRDFPYIHALTSIYFRDVYDHVMRVYTELETQRDLLNNAFEAHMSVLSNEMNVISAKMNQVMNKLTIIATIFMPLTFITGIYGMNFRYMPELFWPYGYYIILGIMFLVAVVMYMYFRRRKWV